MSAGAMDAIVIGAGANGLVAAVTLARAGKRVVVLESDDAIGGVGRPMDIAPGFRVPAVEGDAGWLPPAMVRDLGLAGLTAVYPESPLTVAAGPGDFLSLSRDPAAAAAAIRRRSTADAERWPAFVDLVHDLAGFLSALYQRPAPDIGASGLGELAAMAGLGRRLRALGGDRMVDLLRVLPMPVQELLDDRFDSPLLKAALGAGGVQGICQGPRSGGTSFVLLHHLVGAPRGVMRGRGSFAQGPHALATILAGAARARDVTVRTGARVERILVRDDRVTGVALTSGDELTAPLVLSTTTPARTLLGLVDPVWLDPELLLAVRNIRYRGIESRVIFALDALPEVPGLDHTSHALSGLVSLTPSLEALERSYDAAKYGAVSEAPHIELSVPSIVAPSLAPEGKHVMVARVQYTPYRLREGAWDERGATALGERVQRAVETVAPGFGDRIVRRVVLTPADLEARFGLTEGAPSHGELGLDQILFMRPVAGLGRHATPVHGLYLAGAGTHPGPGIAGGSGWLAAQRALKQGAGRGNGS